MSKRVSSVDCIRAEIDALFGGDRDRVVVLEDVARLGATRAAGALAGTFHARATTATIRAHLISTPARIARSARRLTLHLPQHWPWEPAWINLHAAVHRPSQARTT